MLSTSLVLCEGNPPVTSGFLSFKASHGDVIKWKHFPRYWPFVRGIHWSPVNSPHKDQWRGALMFSLIYGLNKQLNKQSWGRWFDMPTCSLWCHCNGCRALMFSLLLTCLTKLINKQFIRWWFKVRECSCDLTVGLLVLNMQNAFKEFEMYIIITGYFIQCSNYKGRGHITPQVGFEGTVHLQLITGLCHVEMNMINDNFCCENPPILSLSSLICDISLNYSMTP